MTDAILAAVEKMQAARTGGRSESLVLSRWYLVVRFCGASMSGTAVEVEKSFSAGTLGKDVRSDLRVSFKPRSSGGIEIELVSRVALIMATHSRSGG